MDAATMQTVVVALIVAVAALAVGRRAWKLVAATRKKPEDGCGGGCCK